MTSIVAVISAVVSAALNLVLVWKLIGMTADIAALLREFRTFKEAQRIFNAEVIAAKDIAVRQGEQSVEALITIQETQETLAARDG